MNPNNEIIKEKYYIYCQQAIGYSDKTIKKIVQAMRYYEDFTHHADLKNLIKIRQLVLKSISMIKTYHYQR